MQGPVKAFARRGAVRDAVLVANCLAKRMGNLLKGLGFSVEGLGFRVQGLGLRF